MDPCPPLWGVSPSLRACRLGCLGVRLMGPPGFPQGPQAAAPSPPGVSPTPSFPQGLSEASGIWWLQLLQEVWPKRTIQV